MENGLYSSHASLSVQCSVLEKNPIACQNEKQRVNRNTKLKKWEKGDIPN